MDHAHPDCWQRPWKGEVLAHNDPRAWTNTLAFHSTPSQAEVDAHLANLAERGLDVTDKTPVLYCWGVAWETAEKVAPYAVILRRWFDARKAKYVAEAVA
jgi:hypothetical protein